MFVTPVLEPSLHLIIKSLIYIELSELVSVVISNPPLFYSLLSWEIQAKFRSSYRNMAFSTNGIGMWIMLVSSKTNKEQN